MTKQEIQTNMVGRRVRPGGYAKAMTEEEIIRTEDDTTTPASRRHWLEYTNRERAKTKEEHWGKAELGEVVNVYIEDGAPRYTVVMEDGFVRELWGTYLEVVY